MGPLAVVRDKHASVHQVVCEEAARRDVCLGTNQGCGEGDAFPLLRTPAQTDRAGDQQKVCQQGELTSTVSHNAKLPAVNLAFRVPPSQIGQHTALHEVVSEGAVRGSDRLVPCTGHGCQSFGHLQYSGV